MGIYLDHACTSSPKPACVGQAISAFLAGGGFNVNRGSYAGALDAEDVVLDCRERLASLFGAGDARNVVFTSGDTAAINLVLRGLLHPGDHVVVSSMEHNAVMRPLTSLERQGVTFTRVACAPDGSLDAANVEQAICPNTRLVMMTHASNVCGTVLPLAQVGAIAHAHGIPLAVDSAQTAGILPVTLAGLNADAICFAGHKGLMGPQGIGGVVLAPQLAQRLDPLIEGGTGSVSDSEVTPQLMPDKFEAGTLNLPGIVGLGASLSWLARHDPGQVRAHELALTRRLLEGLLALEDEGLVHVVGKRWLRGRTGVVSITTPKADEATVAYRLDAEHGVQTRVGLHCAPSAHKTLGTFPGGTIRFSLGLTNTEAEVDAALAALAACARD